MPKLLREPLIHFILLGAALFAAHGVWQRWVEKQDYTINVSAAEIQRQAAIFAKENQRQPSDEDIQGLLFAHVEEQVLMKEAERLGLGEDDTIIRRRLAQKMRFMLNETVQPDLPKESELRSWFEARKNEFVLPEKRAFSHIYLSPGMHDDIEASGAAVMAEVNNENWTSLGDPFIEQRSYGRMDSAAISRIFGRRFAASVFQLKDSREWQGPVGSSLGLHIIRIDQVTPSVAPDFEDAKSEVAARWQEETLRQSNILRLENLLKKYKVEIEDLEQ